MKNFAAFALVHLLILIAHGQKPTDEIESRIGIVDVNKRGAVCLTIPNAELAAGSSINLVLPDKPQKIVTASIEKKLSQNCTDNPDLNGDSDFSYQLKLTKGKIKAGNVAIALVKLRDTINTANGVVSADVDDDRKQDSFRSCTSQEGLWLSVWSGKPLQDKRIWNRYYYLGYDVVPSCKAKDFKD